MICNFSLARLSRLPAWVRSLVFLLFLVIGWLPLGVGAWLLIPDDNLANITASVLLFFAFLVWVFFWSMQVHHCSNPFRWYGLVWTPVNLRELGYGFLVANGCLLGLFLLEAAIGWVEWQRPDLGFVRVVLEASAIATIVGFAEELFFRGWFLDELQRDYPLPICLWGNSFVFAALHFIRPLEEIQETFLAFPGLMLLGAALVRAKWCSYGCDRLAPKGRLGYPIGLHAGLVWLSYLLHVGQLFTYSGTGPAWMTGMGGDPLAGVLGLVFLSGLTAYLWQQRFVRSPL